MLSQDRGSISRRDLYAAACVAFLIIASSAIFTLLTLPPHPAGLELFSINKAIFESMARMMASDWARPLWPTEYEMKRIYWWPTTLYPTYFAERFLGPFASYFLFFGLFIAVSFAAAFYLTGSLVFASTMGFMFAFGTQMNYIYTNGTLVILYIVLAYCVVNLTILILLLQGRISQKAGYIAYAGSLFIIALSSEWWINYAFALSCSAIFGLLWAWRHDKREIAKIFRFIIGVTLLMLVCYLIFRLQYPAQLTRHGEEEELILTYNSKILFFEDIIVNFFTFLYQSLSNYFPAFTTSSSSLTYVGAKQIIAEQHGYHAEYQNLVLMSHVFMWRFYAGILATIFIAVTAYTVFMSFEYPKRSYAILSILMIMVLTGFATHLTIKMRPYNSVPALPYKVIFSVSAFTVLISYLVMLAHQRLKTTSARGALIACVWACVFIASLTRPGMQSRLLEQVGLHGLRDPIGQILPSQ